MDLRQQWQEISQDLYKKSNLFNSHGRFAGWDVSPMGLPSNNESMNVPLATSPLFFNIVPRDEALHRDEFAQSLGRAVTWEMAEDSPPAAPCGLVYAQLTPHWHTHKRLYLEQSPQSPVDFGVDPLSLGLWKSNLFKNEVSPELVVSVQDSPHRLFRLSGQAYGLTGASDSQQVAVLVTSLLQLLDDYPLESQSIWNQVSLELCLTPHFTLSLSTLISLRLLLSRVAELMDLSEWPLPPLYVVPSARHMSAREPWNNLLRYTSIQMAALMGGAQGVVQWGDDIFSGNQNQRVGRNMTEILLRESHLRQVSNPIQGSYCLEELGGEFCHRTWTLIQEILKKGGVREVLRSGWLHDQIKAHQEKETQSFLKREMKIVGVNQFVMVNPVSEQMKGPKPADVQDIETWWATQSNDDGATVLCDVERLVPRSLSSLFEDWQFKGDCLREKGQGRDSLPLFIEPDYPTGGKKIARAKNLLALGGLNAHIKKPEDGDGHAVAIIIASEPDNSFTQSVGSHLRKQGCHLIWLGDRGFENFDDHLGSSCDLPGVFARIYKKLGVQS